MSNEPIRNLTFSVDWSGEMRCNWPIHVFPLVDRSQPLRWLELGSFEGRSAIWTVENVLTHPASKIYCIDLWNVGHLYSNRPNYDFEAVFDANVRTYPQIAKIKGASKDILPTLRPNNFHGCYIDASHEKEDVLRDGRLVLPLMRAGAVVIFDDYYWPDSPGVKAAVDTLLLEWTQKVRIVRLGYQAIIQVNP